MPEALISAKERHTIKEEPIQRMEKIGGRPNLRPTGNKPCRFCGAPNWTPLHKCPAKKQIETNAEEKDIMQMVCRRKYTNNRTVKRLVEEEIDDRDETTSESENLYTTLKR